MAANSSVYSTNTLQGYSTSEDVTLALLPLNLAEYGGAMSSLFYLDDVRTLKDKSNKEVFVGLVATNSFNYGMRPASRLGKGRFLKDGVTYVMCNDGGLNTYAFAEIVDVQLTYANYIKLRVRCKGAYYSTTYMAGAKIKRTNGTQLDDYLPIFYNRPSKEDSTVTFVYQPTWLNEGDVIQVIPYTQNDENKNSSGSYTTRKEFASFGSFTLGTLVSFLNLIKISSATADIATGTPYTVVITQEDYTKNWGFNTLFASAGGESNKYNTNIFLKGLQGEDNIQDATFTTVLPQGFYYGVPTAWGGTNKEIIYVEGNQGHVTKWYEYTEPATTFNVTTTASVDVTGQTFTARVNVNAIVGTSVIVQVELQFDMGLGSWDTATGTEYTLSFTTAGTKEVSHTFQLGQLWRRARWKVTSAIAYPSEQSASNITENILTNATLG